jgi:hypothetical protein
MSQGTLIVAIVGLFLVTSNPARSQDDANPALNFPDKVAWTLFIEVNAGAKSPGNNNALFETWANDGDTFNPNPQWPIAAALKVLRPPILPQIRQRLLLRRGGPTPQVVPGGNLTEEVRRNRPSFDFIVGNNLHKVSGLKAAFGKPIVFPVDAIEIKANWVPVDRVPTFTNNHVTVEQAPQLYHVNTANDGKQYTLVAMHVISKLVPNWTWATFEHKDNPGRCDILGCTDNFGARQARVEPNPQIDQSYPDCVKTPALLAMFENGKTEKVYQNYCLKASQTDFTDSTGLAVRVGNSITEQGFVAQALCMTCHARAAFDNTGGATTAFAGFDPVTGNAPIGPVDPTWFWAAQGGPPYFPMFVKMPTTFQVTPTLQQADFVWSIPFCAINDASSPPETISHLCASK